MSVGSLVSPGTVITTLDDISRDQARLHGAPRPICSRFAGACRSRAIATGLPDRKFDGQSDDIDSRVDPVTRSIIVRAELPNPEGSYGRACS